MTNDQPYTVQAHWSVGDEARSYSPVVASNRAEARRIAGEMAETLSHFVGLEIVIQPVETSETGTS